MKSYLISENIAGQYKNGNDFLKKEIHLQIWNNSEDTLRYEVKKYNVLFLFDDIYQVYFDILSNHLESYDPEKGTFDRWNRLAMKKAMVKCIRFYKGYRITRTYVNGIKKQVYEPRQNMAIDESKLGNQDNQIIPDGILKILENECKSGTISVNEAQILYYKFNNELTSSQIADMYNISQTAINKTISKGLDKLKKQVLLNPVAFGR